MEKEIKSQALGARGKLSRQLIFDTALEIVDREGAEALSMRRLADELGVNPMAFYKHIDDKEALLEGVVYTFLERLELPLAEAESWQEWLRRLARFNRRIFAEHPHLFDLLMEHPGSGPTLEVYDAFIGVLKTAGFDHEQIHSAWHALQTHIIGYAYQERAWSDRPPSSTGQAARDPDGPQLKNLRELAPQIAACDLPTQFEVGLDLLIASLERLLQTASGR